jgi:hypothetical protein
MYFKTYLTPEFVKISPNEIWVPSIVPNKKQGIHFIWSAYLVFVRNFIFHFLLPNIYNRTLSFLRDNFFQEYDMHVSAFHDNINDDILFCFSNNHKTKPVDRLTMSRSHKKSNKRYSRLRFYIFIDITFAWSLLSTWNDFLFRWRQ